MKPVGQLGNSIWAIVNLKLIRNDAGVVEVEINLQGTGCGVVGGVARGIPAQRLKGVAKPILPDVGDLPGGIAESAGAGGVKSIDPINGLCLRRRQTQKKDDEKKNSVNKRTFHRVIH